FAKASSRPALRSSNDPQIETAGCLVQEDNGAALSRERRDGIIEDLLKQFRQRRRVTLVVTGPQKGHQLLASFRLLHRGLMEAVGGLVAVALGDGLDVALARPRRRGRGFVLEPDDQEGNIATLQYIAPLQLARSPSDPHAVEEGTIR